jgi:hypothetical protein
MSTTTGLLIVIGASLLTIGFVLGILTAYVITEKSRRDFEAWEARMRSIGQ